MKVITECVLERPGDKFLINIGHNSGIYRTKDGKEKLVTYKISKILCFDNFIVNGYDDGLILVWSQKVK